MRMSPTFVPAMDVRAMKGSSKTKDSGLRSLLRRFFVTTFLKAQDDARYRILSERAHGLDFQTIAVCVVAAFSLTSINYLGNLDFTLASLHDFGLTGPAADINRFLIAISNERLAGLIWWASTTVCFYFVLPALFIRLALRQPLSSYGLKAKGGFKDYRLYLMMFALMVPIVLTVSGMSSFQARYPFYQVGKGEGLLPFFWQWEFFYFLQFFSLEFFFRGFMVHGLKHRFGYYSVFVMSVPYCMIHFHKPMLEALAAIAAGVILGTLSLKSRSILLGVAIHYSVAITMDIAALWRKGLLW